MLLTTLSTFAILSTSSASDEWNYEHFDWGTTDNFCGSQHHEQSPIDINTASGLSSQCPTNSPFKWELGTAQSGDITSFEMKNSGHGLQITPKGPFLGILSNRFGNGGNYCLDQFHAHWGESDVHGSEHTINGRSAALEMHFVHHLCKYGTFDKALNADGLADGDRYTLAVVSVLYYIDDDDDDSDESGETFLDYIIRQTLHVRSKDQTHSLPNIYNMEDLVPSNNDDNDPQYLYYKGSLTTPGCNPIVRWHLLSKPMHITSSQIHTLRTRLHDNNDQLISHNYRPVQYNTNTVYLCGDQHEEGDDDDDDDDDSR